MPNGYIKCKTTDAKAGSKPIGGGSESFLVDTKCNKHFVYFGTVCTDFSNENIQASFEEAKNICSNAKTIYITKSQHQNTIFRHGMSMKV